MFLAIICCWQSLYSRFAADLKRVRTEARAFCDHIYLTESKANRTYSECRPGNNKVTHTEASQK